MRFPRLFYREWEAWSARKRGCALIVLLALMVGATVGYLGALSIESRKIVAATVIGLCALLLASLALKNARKKPREAFALPPEKHGWEPELVLAGVDLRDATLPDTHLERSEITNAVLAGANLSGATLAASLLAGADLRGADLRGANLCGADLRGADLRDAKTAGAEFLGATYDDQTRWPGERAHADATHVEADATKR